MPDETPAETLRRRERGLAATLWHVLDREPGTERDLIESVRNLAFPGSHTVSAEPTARDPWTVTLAFARGQNWDRVSVMPRRAPVRAIVGMLRAGESVDTVAEEHGLLREQVQVLAHLADDLDEPWEEQPEPDAEAAPYELTARAIDTALEAACMEVTVVHDGQPVGLLSLARVLDKAGLIDWTGVRPTGGDDE